MRAAVLAVSLLAMPLMRPGARAQSPRFDAWRIAYTVPDGWRITQQQGRVHTLGVPTNDVAIYVAPGMYQSFEEVAAELPKAFAALGLTGMPNGQPQNSTVAGLRAMSATYYGQDRMGTALEAKVIAVLTPHGTGLVALGLTRMGQMAKLAPAMDAAFAGVRADGAPVPDAAAMQALRGKWMYYQGRTTGGSVLSGSTARSVDESVEFDGAGRFAWSSSAYVNVTTPGTGVGGGSSAGGANQQADQGSYTVIGTTLIVRGRQGMASFELVLQGDRFTADGRTYLLERR